MISYEPTAGEDISKTAKYMVTLAKRRSERVTAIFNDIMLTASPSDTPQEIVAYYNEESKRRYDAYISSPEYKERQAKAEKKQRRKEMALKNALAVAPPLKVTDQTMWDSWVQANTDDYGSATMRFTEWWGRLMQVQIQQGKQLDDCADECCSVADTEGITGFMYGCAVSMLAQVWEYGEQLRRWHNLKTQIGSEGEAANKSGGTLNPALLKIG